MRLCRRLSVCTRSVQAAVWAGWRSESESEHGEMEGVKGALEKSKRHGLATENEPGLWAGAYVVCMHRE